MKLTKDESAILKSYNRGEYKPLPAKEVEKFRQAARRTIYKSARINVRIAQGDLDLLKEKAQEEGLPYQSLVASVLHKYATSMLVDVANARIARHLIRA